MSKPIQDIYERLVAEGTIKAGRPYEILAAFVWKILDDSSTVVHDIDVRVAGHETVNQIDVHLSGRSGERRRVIIECRDKDKDSASPNLDQNEARSFALVAHQLRRDPDDPLTEAIMLTTVGFTSGAKHVAADEGLVLAILEPANVIREIHLELQVQSMGVPQITAWIWRDESERQRLLEELGPRQYAFHQETDAAFFYDADGNAKESYREVLEPIFHGLKLSIGANAGAVEFDRTRHVELEPGVQAAVQGFEYRVQVDEHIQRSINDAGRRADLVAELVLRSLDSTLPSRIITAGELQGLERSPDGEIRPRDP